MRIYEECRSHRGWRRRVQGGCSRRCTERNVHPTRTSRLAHPMLPFPFPTKRILHWRITCLSVPSRLPDFDSRARCRGSRSTDSIKSKIVHSDEPLLLLHASLVDVQRHRPELSSICIYTECFHRFVSFNFLLFQFFFFFSLHSVKA